jgi:hypothetical protein
VGKTKEAVMAAEAAPTSVQMGDIKNLELISKRLNAVTDELNPQIEAIQKKFNTLGLGVESWVEGTPLRTSVQFAFTERNHDDGSEVQHRTLRSYELGYGRLGDGWALLVRSVDYLQLRQSENDTWVIADEGTEIDRKPLLRSSRDDRILAIQLIPKLVDRLQETAEEILKAVEQAKKLADAL